ncbi:P1 family peptidase [Pseudochrobactrum sp. MP213Fo]|uniref:P1 family peptidase n=1 Tax=Pseudochrobactrum sp. MP213Fo TaxID=3022250 RepID=UPI003BA1557F
MTIISGQRNLITDVAGLRVGHAQDDHIKTGVTAILCDRETTAAVQVLGGAPGTRETDLLEPHNTVQHVNAIVLAGGSAFGLDAASGVQAYLRANKIGFEAAGHHIPIVPAAILFDMHNGGNKEWQRYPPYRELGYLAAENAAQDFTLGSAGAGAGALVAGIKGGLGSASHVLNTGITLGALVAVNAVGSVTIGQSRHFWAAPFEQNAEFGGLGYPHPLPVNATEVRIKFRDASPQTNTTIGAIATDAVLTKAQAKRLAIAAHDGYARAIWPAHTPFDGDLIFALATGASGIEPSVHDFIDLCAAAASTMARAVARGVYLATPQDNDLFPCWQQLKD